jgi:hypothetical protein
MQARVTRTATPHSLSLYSYLRLRQLRSSMGLRQITNTPAAVHRRARSDDEELADLQRAIESAESDLARKRKQIEDETG